MKKRQAIDMRCYRLDHADVERVVRWIEDRKRKPANLAFTEGPERRIAYAIEQMIFDMEHPF